MKGMSRREFLASSGVLLAGAGVVLCGLNGCATMTGKGSTPEIASGAYVVENGAVSLTLAAIPQLARVGGSVKILDPALAQPLIVARVAEERYVAASIKCTHRGVEVEYDAREQGFECASLGGSEFGLDGSNTEGPAKKPLNVYAASLAADNRGKLVIDLS